MAAVLNSLFVGLLLVFSTSAVRAESYPVRTIRLVVPWPAGGIVDALGRIIGKKMSDNLGQPVVVDSWPLPKAIGTPRTSDGGSSKASGGDCF